MLAASSTTHPYPSFAAPAAHRLSLLSVCPFLFSSSFPLVLLLLLSLLLLSAFVLLMSSLCGNWGRPSQPAPSPVRCTHSQPLLHSLLHSPPSHIPHTHAHTLTAPAHTDSTSTRRIHGARTSSQLVPGCRSLPVSSSVGVRYRYGVRSLRSGARRWRVRR